LQTRRCPRLESLEIAACLDVSDDDVEQLGATLSSAHFKRLALRACPSIHDLSVSFIAATAPGLEALELSGCVNISDAALAALLRAQEALLFASAGRSRLASDAGEAAAGGAASRLGSSGSDSSGADASPKAAGGGAVDTGTGLGAAGAETVGGAMGVGSTSPSEGSSGSERSPDGAADSTAAVFAPAPASPAPPSSDLLSAGGTTAAAAVLAAQRPGLRSLRIAGCRRLTAEGLIALCSSRVLRLRELSLSGLDDSMIAACLPVSAPRGGGAFSGAAGGTYARSTSDVLSHAAAGPRLYGARPPGSTASAHAEGGAGAGFWSHIAHLELTQCGVSDEGLAHLLAACRNLRSLRLRWCPLLSERCLPPVLSCRTLIALRVDACKRLGTAFAVAQRQAYPQVLITATA
jgi:hypothetical protein